MEASTNSSAVASGDKEVWIVSAKRTPLGSFQGQFASLSAPTLGAYAVKGALESIGIFTDALWPSKSDGIRIDEVLMGCVLPAGCGQAPARQAALNAGLPISTGCVTVNKVCGSGMKTVMLATDMIRAGSIHTAIAGGMESMTNAPYLLKQAREGFRLGHQTTHDHMFLDGLQDAYEGDLMGVYAQRTADATAFSRESMDEWAAMSVQRARQAIDDGAFDQETCPVVVADRKGEHLVKTDEHPHEVDPEKIPKLKPVFAKDGSVTAANSSAIADGAAALLLMDSNTARQHGLEPLAIVRGQSTHARLPAEFTIAPVDAIRQLLDQLSWRAEDVDLWEINEAFAVVTQIAVKELQLDAEKVNIHGGACALGHPIGASGARIIVSLIHALRRMQQNGKSVRRGIASLCIGGGEATAIAIELPSD
ncbi:acetyl-CoA C-acyltransferase (plasmid) [Photobacterium sp. GJ3]|uniref:thiolase family protein n=1 Tax=Photobacterium sp. GJ3 TaxID=2829502 RepID=UPI001B8D3A77|nr:acetyl-CoA C-acyltransferase [Photobacterium sp. GJ3]QUJ70507.1 acetyl-CoA C-acyltransferase [Photobacterium sp. GJ3]